MYVMLSFLVTTVDPNVSCLSQWGFANRTITNCMAIVLVEFKLARKLMIDSFHVQQCPV